MEELKVKLTELGVNEEMIGKIIGELGVTGIEDLSCITEVDLVSIGMKTIQARKLAASLAPVKIPAPIIHSAEMAGAAAVSFEVVLPSVPTDESWLEALRTGGVLKVDQSTIISAIRAALAHRAGLFSIPDVLVEKMENFADTNEEQVNPEFFKIRKHLTKRSYGEIFSVIDGLDGSYVTDARKKQLFQRIDKILWPAIHEFYEQLKSWQEAWMQGTANPALMMSMVFMGNQGGGIMPPGVMQPPETGALRDYADSVADAINKVFAGTGVQIAAALAYDATKIREMLSNGSLPTLIGATNRDQMLRQLGVSVSASYPRLETNITKFVLGVIQAKDQSAGNEEIRYFGALYMLGSQIPWDQLGYGKKPAGIGERL